MHNVEQFILVRLLPKRRIRDECCSLDVGTCAVVC